MASAAVLTHTRCGPASARAGSRPSRAQRQLVARAQQQQVPIAQRAAALGAKLLGGAAAAAVLLGGDATLAPAAFAREKVAEFGTSGLIFKDTVRIIELEDDKVDGVVIYLTDYNRSITERLAKDPFSDPSQASLTCLASRPVSVPDPAAIAGGEGKEIFSERKGLNLFQNKNLRVRRIYDDKNQVVLYVAYSTRFTGAADEKDVSTSRYRTSVCAVPVAPAATAPALVPVAAEAAAEE